MRLTSKGRYAVTAMLDVALHSQTGPVPLADISERQGISLSYLEQLFSRLRKNELVSSVRGRAAGIYWVANPVKFLLLKLLLRLMNLLMPPVVRGIKTVAKMVIVV